VGVQVLLLPVRFSAADAANLPPTPDRAGEARRSMFSHRCDAPGADRVGATEEDRSGVLVDRVTA
jgi:hypothetical protein